MIGLRASPELRRSIEGWAKRQGDNPLLSEAIRRLVELGLEAPAKKLKEEPPGAALIPLGRRRS
jgi:hypothetical protein